LTIAKVNNIKKGEKIIEEIKAVVCNWKQYAKRVNVSKKLTATITKNLVCFNID